MEKTETISVSDEIPRGSGAFTAVTTNTLQENTGFLVRRKLDKRLLPILSGMYFFNNIDRMDLENVISSTNTNAKLNITDNEYLIIQGLFYIGFCLFVLPTTLLQKRLGARIILPSLMLGWGAMTLLEAATSSWGGLAAVQFFLGAFQSGFLACTIVYLSSFYKRNELGFRISIVYGSATIAGSFNILISRVILDVGTSFDGWKLLMIIEGIATVAITGFAFCCLPKSITTCSWLTQEEKLVAEQRILQDGSSSVNEKFKLNEALSCLFDWHTVAFAVIGLFFGAAASSAQITILQITPTLDVEGITLDFYYVAAYTAGCTVLFMTSASSDFYRERSTHIAGTMLVTLIGFINLTTVYYIHMRASACFNIFLLAVGAVSPCIYHAWYSNNVIFENNRTVITGVIVGAVHVGGIIAMLAFKNSTSSTSSSNTTVDDLQGLKIAVIFQALALGMTFAYGAWMRYDNRKRDQTEGAKRSPEDVPTETLVHGTGELAWRWTV